MEYKFKRDSDGNFFMVNKLGRTVAPSLIEEYGLTDVVDMDVQTRAYEEYVNSTIADYTEMRQKHGYTDEEKFEMKAAFGPDEDVVDVFTGRKIDLA